MHDTVLPSVHGGGRNVCICALLRRLRAHDLQSRAACTCPHLLVLFNDRSVDTAHKPMYDEQTKNKVTAM